MANRLFFFLYLAFLWKFSAKVFCFHLFFSLVEHAGTIKYDFVDLEILFRKWLFSETKLDFVLKIMASKHLVSVCKWLSRQVDNCHFLSKAVELYSAHDGKQTKVHWRITFHVNSLFIQNLSCIVLSLFSQFQFKFIFFVVIQNASFLGISVHFVIIIIRCQQRYRLFNNFNT